MLFYNPASSSLLLKAGNFWMLIDIIGPRRINEAMRECEKDF
jgi:hypothetical protein